MEALRRLLHSRGELGLGEEFTHSSVLGTQFRGRLLSTGTVAGNKFKNFLMLFSGKSRKWNKIDDGIKRKEVKFQRSYGKDL